MPRYFSERGKNYDEVFDKIRRKYGDHARVMMHKNVPMGGLMGLLGKEQVEVSGVIAVGEEARQQQQSADNRNRNEILASVGKTTPPPAPENGPCPAAAGGKNADNLDTGSNDENLGRVLVELQDIKSRMALGASTPPPEPFPVLSELEEILKDNDFGDEYIGGITRTLREELRAADLDDRACVHETAAGFIAESIPWYRQEAAGGPRVFVLVGPTGVGKTTTIAKLAAVNGLSGDGADVRILTVDSFRIGARAQVETYGEIMGIPVKAVEDYDDLRAQIALASDADLVLVDTIGKSPRDSDKIEQMRKLLEACGEKAEVHLALSSTTKTADLREIMTQFERFGYRSVILTKLDETSRVGNLIGVLAEKAVPVSYLTDGQSVPVDITLASPARLVARLRGLEYDDVALEKRYPAADLTAAWR